MKISTFYDHIMQAQAQTGRSVEDLLAEVKSYGIEGLEIHYEDLVRQREWLLPLLRRIGLEISCIYETYDFVTNPKAASAIDLLDQAKEVGAGRVLIIPGFLSPADYEHLHPLHEEREQTFTWMDKSLAIQNIRTALTELVILAGSKGIAVTLEDYDDDRAPYSRKYQLLYFMERVPGLRYTFDMGNFIYAGEDAQDAYDTLLPYLVHVHCKDRRQLTCVVTGKGTLPIAEMIQRLKADGYQDYLAIEHFDAPNQMAYLAQSAEFMRRQIG